MKQLATAALLALTLATPAAAQINNLPGIALPPNTVMGNTLPVPGFVNAVPFAVLTPQLLSSITGDLTCSVATQSCTIGNGAVTGAKIATGTIVNANLASMAADTVKCNPASSAAGPQDCNAFGLVGSQTIVSAASPTNGTYFGTNSGAVNWCPGWPGGCSNGTAGGTWTAQLFAVGTTAGNPAEQESSILSVLNVDTGFAFVWKGTTAYVSGNYAVNGSNLFLETAASCTSAASGGPTGTGSGIVDGTCTWNYQAPSFAAGKQAGNFNTIGQSGGGHIWGSTSTAFTQSGWNSQFAAGAEIDAGNASSVGTQFGVGPAQIYNLYLGGVNANPITAALYISPQGSASPASAQYGIIFNGANAFSSGVIFNNSTGSTVGYVDQGSHTSSSINDASTSPIGINLTGHYSTTAVNIAPASGSTALSFTGGITANGNVGVTCSGTPTSSFATNNGIVTHC